MLRDSPPVYVVNDFLTEEECGFMMNRTVPHMGPSVVGGGGTSQGRKSYSVNMQPDFEDESHIFTQASLGLGLDPNPNPSPNPNPLTQPQHTTRPQPARNSNTDAGLQP